MINHKKSRQTPFLALKIGLYQRTGYIKAIIKHNILKPSRECLISLFKYHERNFVKVMFSIMCIACYNIWDENALLMGRLSYVIVNYMFGKIHHNR